MSKQPEVEPVLQLPNGFFDGFGSWLVDFLSVTAWPVVVLVPLCLYKKDIVKFLGEIVELKVGQASLKREAQPAVSMEKSVSKTQEPFLSDKNSLEKDLETNRKKYPAISSEFKSIESDIEALEDEKKIKLLAGVLAQSNFFHWCQRTHSIIYGTQIQLLEKINANECGVSRGFIDQHFQEAKAQYPAFYSTIILHQYINFLLFSNLLSFEDNYEITELGKSFCTWASNTGHNSKPF